MTVRREFEIDGRRYWAEASDNPDGPRPFMVWVRRVDGGEEAAIYDSAVGSWGALLGNPEWFTTEIGERGLDELRAAWRRPPPTLTGSA